MSGIEAKTGQYLIQISYLNDLIGFKLKIQNIGKRDRSALSDFHWQILKSRQMIFEMPEILVAKPNEKLCLFALMTKEFYSNMSIFKSFLNAHNIMIEYEIPTVSITLFQYCFAYTMQVRLSPYWNYVNGLFIKGKYFILEKNLLDSVEVKISAENEQTMSLKIKGFRVQMPPPSLEDFTSNIKQIKCLREKKIEKINFEKKQILKLPSLLPGEVESISTSIPKSCPLRSYNDMRRHWKNMYGYRLPDSGEDIYYVNVHVRLGQYIDEKCYPHICGRLEPIQQIYVPNSEDIVQSFVSTLDSNMGLNNICNHAIRIQPYLPTLKSMTQDFTQNISLCTPTLRSGSSFAGNY
ncbi:uncharacterized protein C18orf63-like [Chrysoperla carnea]|uniref:uncharacterized protein C18orf63-like n=1 Tax=Chrysoperla carnea TaxID=189513 RepID=UPI001D078757|nr:uncharacterized protein C18orf63-like [Chrysoperla carnea]